MIIDLLEHGIDEAIRRGLQVDCRDTWYFLWFEVKRQETEPTAFVLDMRLQLLMQAEVTVVYHQYPFKPLDNTPIRDNGCKVRDTKGSINVDYAMLQMLNTIFLWRGWTEHFESKTGFAQTR